LSQHVGGFVIAEDPLHTLVPIENAAMPDRTVIQWDKDDLESLGLLKVDVLALGMLSALRRSFDLIKAWHRIELTPSTLPAEDGDTYTMLQNADAIGVFQVESRAQLNMLPRLKPACFYDLAIEVAIVRPGPIQGGMVNPYLRRREGTEPVVYPSNDLKAVLERTLGVPVFQEQVMQIAMVAAGFSPGEADQLRRAMAAWGRRGDLEQFQQRLYLGMSERGYSEEFAESIFNQIKGFGAYGFPESHAISFALLTYSSAYLKCHYPVEFCCALLNSLPMGFYSADDLIQDLIRHNKEVRPVCVLNSEWEYSLEPGTSGRYRDVALRAGLCSVNGLSYADIQPLLQRRKQAPKSLAAFVEYIGINRKAQQQLNRANAFRALSPNRHQTHWTLMGLSSHPLEESDHSGVEHIPAPSAADNLVADYQSVGYSLEHHPLALMRESLIQRGVLTVAEWKARVANNGRARLMGLIKTRQRPGSAAGVMFMTLEDETGHANIVVWPKLLEKQRRILLGAKLIEVRGKMQRHDKVLHLIAEHVTDQTDSLGQLRYKNRAFR
ncbi:MAG: error-prone DNA polymerase, partial [Gammaproteobacteria bacterium]|nr:error-prone DNA polymerase [Gammaproteobacteria bacterium]